MWNKAAVDFDAFVLAVREGLFLVEQTIVGDGGVDRSQQRIWASRRSSSSSTVLVDADKDCAAVSRERATRGVPVLFPYGRAFSRARQP